MLKSSKEAAAVARCSASPGPHWPTPMTARHATRSFYGGSRRVQIRSQLIGASRSPSLDITSSKSPVSVHSAVRPDASTSYVTAPKHRMTPTRPAAAPIPAGHGARRCRGVRPQGRGQTSCSRCSARRHSAIQPEPSQESPPPGTEVRSAPQAAHGGGLEPPAGSAARQ